MIKILHAADLHLDSPLSGRSDALRGALLAIPGKLAEICRRERCDLVLLAGDLFDGAYTKDSLNALRNALAEMDVPVFISPGNHDFSETGSPYSAENWPENVHIFHYPMIETVELEELGCKIYGAGFHSMDSGPLLKEFHISGEAGHHIAVMHGDPTQVTSPYNPITAAQVRDSGLDYLALGHIHKAGSFRAGSTLCAWPGAPMGRGYDEEGEKGVLLVTLDQDVQAQFIPLDTPRFHDLETEPEEDALAALEALLPPVGSEDFYRVTFTGPSAPLDLAALAAEFDRFPNLVLRDRTVPETDIWSALDSDSLEGMIFRNLWDTMEGQDEQTQARLRLAAKLTRRILDGQEVKLP